MKGLDLDAAKKERQARTRQRSERTPSSPAAPSAFREGEHMECPVCDGDMVFTRGLSHSARSLAVANLAAFVCNLCGERSYDPPSLGSIQEATRQ